MTVVYQIGSRVRERLAALRLEGSPEQNRPQLEEANGDMQDNLKSMIAIYKAKAFEHVAFGE